MSELEFLGALEVELLRHREVRPELAHHELFQTSTIRALLEGAFDGDITLRELLEHGDLGLGTLNGLDGEMILLDGEVWRAEPDCSLRRAGPACKTPYAVVVPFSPGEPAHVRGPFDSSQLNRHIRHRTAGPGRPTAIRLDARFATVHVRSVPKQKRPYPSLAQAIATQHTVELADVSGTMVGFRFPDALGGIEMVGWHLHFVTGERTRGGHVLGFTLLEGTAWLDDATELHVELPPAVRVPHDVPDADRLRRLEND
jgi:acetolactate decarboxylase